jgi:N-acetylglucosamine malate deacetylase 2
MSGLLVIVPHPDDESALCAGLIARAAKMSVPVRIVFLTSGRHGRTLDLVPQAALAAERRKEATLATGALGAKDVYFLGYPDFDPRRQKIFGWTGVKKKLLSSVGDVSAGTVIVSFPPNGLNGHPDHVRCSRFAAELAAERGAMLLCVTPKEAPAPGAEVNSYMKAQRRRKLHMAPTHRLRLTQAEMEKKLCALSHYRTQALSILDFTRNAKGRLFEEYFAVARNGGPQARRLLAGLLQALA